MKNNKCGLCGDTFESEELQTVNGITYINKYGNDTTCSQCLNRITITGYRFLEDGKPGDIIITGRGKFTGKIDTDGSVTFKV